MLNMTNLLPANRTNKLVAFTPIAFMLAALLPDYFAPVITFIGFVSVLRKKFTPANQPHFGTLGISIIIYIAWMVIGAFYSSSAVSSLASIGLWLLVFTNYYFYSKAAVNEEIVDSVMYLGGISAGVSGAIGIGQMVLYHIDKDLSRLFNPFWHFINVIVEKIVALLPEVITAKMPSTTFHSFDTRACSTFTNPLFFAAVEVMLLPFAAYLFLCAPTRKKRLLGLLCFMLAAGGIAVSYSRGPYIFAVLVCIILLLHGGKKALKLMGLGAGALGVVMIFASGTVKRIFTLISGTDVSVNTRVALWDGIFDMIHNKPIFGHGTGFDNVRQQLHNVYGVKQPHAHNILLEAWAENGIIGVILFVAILVVFFINMVNLFRKKGKAREYSVTLFASVAGFVLCGMTDCLFYGIKPLQYFMMILGLSQAVYLLYNNKTASDGGKQ